MKWRTVAAVCLAWATHFAFIGDAHAADSRNEAEHELQKPLVRGGIVFKVIASSATASAAMASPGPAKLYGNVDLEIGPRPVEHYEKIIRGGGLAVNRSEYMPPWQDELSDEQIGDVVAYLSVVTNQEKRGEAVFKANCILCHGVKGDGKGRASVLFNPPPANLTKSDKNDEYKKMIITYGGAAMGRSPVMPIWGEQLSSQEIDDVVNYLRTLLVTPAQ